LGPAFAEAGEEADDDASESLVVFPSVVGRWRMSLLKGEDDRDREGATD
jgi:hypothetical protein